MSNIGIFSGLANSSAQVLLNAGAVGIQIASTAVIATSSAINRAGNTANLTEALGDIGSLTFNVSAFNRNNDTYYVKWVDGSEGKGFYEVGLKSDLETGKVSTGTLERTSPQILAVSHAGQTGGSPQRVNARVTSKAGLVSGVAAEAVPFSPVSALGAAAIEENGSAVPGNANQVASVGQTGQTD
jgi:hypothetical protein